MNQKPLAGLIAVVLALFVVSVICPSASALSTQEIYEKASASVVVIKTYDQKGLPLAQGSGFIINLTSADTPAFLVTNFHVINGAGEVLFKFDGKWSKAGARYRVDTSKDLAIYRLNFSVEGLLFADGEAKVGQEVVVIGSPEGLENTVSSGIVSGVREIVGRTLMQTTAPVSHGSSGGPMLNKSGAVVGVIVSMLVEAQNVNFAIPVADVSVLITNSRKATVVNDTGLTLGAVAVDEAFAFIILKQYDKAAKHLEDHLDSHPNDDEAWLQLGYAKEKSGLPNEAIRCYRKALSINPEFAYAWFSLGMTYLQLEQRKTFADAALREAMRDAISAFHESLRIDPEFSLAWNSLGLAYWGLGQSSDAISAFRESLRINPEFSSAWKSLGHIYYGLGQKNDAVAAYREGLRINPEDADAWQSLGLAYWRLGQKNDANAAFREAVQINPELADAWYPLGVSYSQLGQIYDAIAAYREVLRIDPKHAKASYGLGLMFLKVGDLSSARQCLQNLERVDLDLAQKLRECIPRPSGK